VKNPRLDRAFGDLVEGKEFALSLAAVHDLRTHRPPASAEELEQLDVDVLAEFVLARASAGVSDGTIRGDISNLEQLRAWFGRQAMSHLSAIFN
jgi:hypothetical protein